MSDCDCGCQIVANNRNRDLGSLGQGTFGIHDTETVNAAGQDAYGPDVIEISGSLGTLFGVFSHWHTFGGMTLIQTVGGSDQYTAGGIVAGWSIVDSARTAGEVWPEFTEQYPPGSATDATFRKLATSAANISTAESLQHAALHLNFYGDSIRTTPLMESWRSGTGSSTGVVVQEWSQLGSTGLLPFIHSITVCVNTDIETGEAFATAHMAPRRRVTSSFFTLPQGELWTYQAGTVNGSQWKWANVDASNAARDNGVPKIFDGPVAVTGEKVALYRNGEIVLQGNRPTSQQSLEATQQSGEYLLVSEMPDEEISDRPFDRRTPRPLMEVVSFVVDRDPFVVATFPLDDYFVGDGFEGQSHRDWLINSTRPIVIATKPCQRNAGTLLGTDDTPLVPAASRLVRPASFSDAGDLRSSSGVSAVFLPAGEHQVTPYRLGEFGVGSKSIAPSYVPSFSLRVHAIPPNNRRGAKAILEDVGLHTREYWRPRLEGEAVRTVRLTFDRKVRADTVEDSQLTLTRNGVAVEGCTMTQKSDFEWLVTLPSVSQDSKSFWLLTYDPAGDVLTDDIVTQNYPRASSFPPIASAKYKVVYVDQETGDRYSKSPGGYVAIGGAPVDENGVEYEPEQCVLATRTAWLMASATGFHLPEVVGTRRTLTIGTTPSIGKALDEAPVDDGIVLVQKRSGLASSSHARTSSPPDSFAPQVPFDGGPSDCSYFGLRTTIHPCPPREVTACACPRSHQRHASVIRSEADITALNVSMVKLDELGNETAFVTPSNSFPRTFPRWGSVELGNEFEGDALPQNVWAATISGLASTTITYPPGTIGSLENEIETIDGGTLFVEAFREVDELADRGTAFLYELQFEIRCRYQREIKQEFNNATERFFYKMEWIYDVFTVSKEQEAALADGDPVYIPYETPLGSAPPAWWKLQVNPAE